MSKFGDFFLELLFPPKCAFCGHVLRRDEKGMCQNCQRELPWIEGQAAEQKLEFISLCVSALWYRQLVRESIRRYKFADRSLYAKTYGRLVSQCVTDHLSGRYDLITWVPLSPRSLKKRGYDQAMLLAMAAALELGEVAVETLRKEKNTSAQSSLTEDAARRANVLGVYEVVDPALIEGRRILLVDDVVTTGATLSECARILRLYGAADVVCVTLARARGDGVKPKKEAGQASEIKN
ncbi:MAG: double zinc ribbon domain-containing protein [Oscillospiraceae bacterium]|nr:double zinc ribbon domain-containing protein [Oscillospiraceae bacterium]